MTAAHERLDAIAHRVLARKHFGPPQKKIKGFLVIRKNETPVFSRHANHAEATVIPISVDHPPD